MNGAVGCRWALRKHGAERVGRGGAHLWMLVDVGRPAAPTPPRPTKGAPKQFRNMGRVSKHPPQESTSNKSGTNYNA